MRWMFCLLSSMVAAFMFMFVGCEWESSGSDDTWDESVSWVNFSGVYRGAYEEGCIVAPAGTTGPGEDTTQPDEVDTFIVNSEAQGTALPNQVTLSGVIGNRPNSIVPGSVTFVFSGPTSGGNVTDDGSGGLTGNYTIANPAPVSFAVSGTIRYDNGQWTMNLAPPGFLENVTIRVSYTYEVPLDDDDANGGGSDTNAVDTCPYGLYTMEVTQQGNVITIRDNTGRFYTGQFGLVATAGGDATGQTSGDVIGNFYVEADDATITGKFQGAYVAPGLNSVSGSGTLTDRVILGTWMHANVTGDVFGYAPSVSVTPTTVPSTTTTGGTAP
jgi:hypothetical protein